MIKIDSVKNYCEAASLPKKLKELFADLKYEKWEEKCKGIQDFVHEYNPAVSEHWGRIGIEFSGRIDWGKRPSIFAGVVLDNSDHELEEFNNNPQFVVLIDYDMVKKDKDKDYGELISRIKKKLQSLRAEPSDFKIEKNPKNKWRLLILKKPLEEIIKVDDNYERQKEGIMNEMVKGINLILNTVNSESSEGNGNEK